MTILQLRQSAGLTVPQLLEGCPIKGIDPPLVSKMERGLIMPTPAFMRYVIARCRQEVAQAETPGLQVNPAALIPMETRRAACEALDRPARRAEILAVWEGVTTPRDVLDKLPYRDMNAVRPRISEMKADGILEPVEKRRDRVTGMFVAAYRITEQGK